MTPTEFRERMTAHGPSLFAAAPQEDAYLELYLPEMDVMDVISRDGNAHMVRFRWVAEASALEWENSTGPDLAEAWTPEQWAEIEAGVQHARVKFAPVEGES
jgi:hypothetical protein